MSQTTEGRIGRRHLFTCLRTTWSCEVQATFVISLSAGVADPESIHWLARARMSNWLRRIPLGVGYALRYVRQVQPSRWRETLAGSRFPTEYPSTRNRLRASSAARLAREPSLPVVRHFLRSP